MLINSIPLCALVNQHLQLLARKFPATKFLRSISATCIPNYPDKNLPTIFVYFEDSMKKQIVGPHAFGGMNLTVEGLCFFYFILDKKHNLPYFFLVIWQCQSINQSNFYLGLSP